MKVTHYGKNFHSDLGLILCFLAALAPAVVLGNAVFNYTVDLIFADEWSMGLNFVHLLQGQLTFDELIAQHNDSRKLFPRLIFIGVAALNNFQYNTFNNCILIFSVACLVSINIFLLSRLTLPLRIWQQFLLFAIANLFIFSPMQWENWNWGIQLVVFIPIASITSALVVTKLRLDFSVIALITALLGTFATFSYANGMLFWVVIFPALLAIKVPTVKQFKQINLARWKLLSLWLLYAALNIGYFFYDYKKAGYQVSLLEVLKKNSADVLHYFLAFLGAPLGAESFTGAPVKQGWFIAQIMGAVLLSCYGLIGTAVWRQRSKAGWLQVVYPWLCIGLYTLLSAILTTIGRVGFGVTQSLSSRYNTFSVYGWLAILYLVVALWLSYQTAESFRTKRGKQLFRIATVGLLVTLLVLQFFSWNYGLRIMKVRYRERLYGKACLLAQNFFIEADCINAYASPGFNINPVALTISQQLDTLEAWKPGMITAQEFNEAVGSQVLGSTLCGYVDTAISQDVGNFFKFSGWAALPEYKFPAHGVMLVALDGKGTPTPFAIAPVDKKRRNVAKVISTSDYRSQRFGWEMNVPKERIPAEATEVIALAIDTNTGNLHRLKGNTQLQR